MKKRFLLVCILFSAVAFLNKSQASESIANNFIESGIQLYPNPVNKILNVEFGLTPQTGIRINTITGSLIKTENTTGSTIQINISDLDAGVYLLQYKIENGNKTQKLITN